MLDRLVGDVELGARVAARALAAYAFGGAVPSTVGRCNPVRDDMLLHATAALRRMVVRSLVDYHHALWRRFADYYVDECSWEELSRDHGASHATIANVTMHAVNMEDWWLHYVLPGRPWTGPRWDGFKDAKSMRQRIHEVEAKTRALLSTTSAADMTTPQEFDSEGMKGVASLEQVLVEVVNEATHHRGEVLAMLWRTDKEPPYIGYLDWVGERG